MGWVVGRSQQEVCEKCGLVKFSFRYNSTMAVGPFGKIEVYKNFFLSL